MRNLTVIVSLLAITLPLGSALAEGDGGGNPFAFRAPGITTDYAKLIRRSPDQDAFQYRSPAQTVKTVNLNEMAPQNGAEGSVQTANSLPRGANAGMANYAQSQALRQYWAARGVTTVKTQVAQPVAAPTATGRNG